MTPVIVVPRRDDNGHRDRLWSFVRGHYEHLGWPIIEGHHTEGRFNRSAAINAAADTAGAWDVAVVIDSDSLADLDQVRAAADTASSTGAMVAAFDRFQQLSKRGTLRVLDGHRGTWSPFVERTLKDGVSSCVAIPRALWDRVGGFDECFDGWGWEDVAFKFACEHHGGPLQRIPGDVWHLWHPRSSERATTDPQYLANQQRARAYKQAVGVDAAMRALTGEQHPPRGARGVTLDRPGFIWRGDRLDYFDHPYNTTALNERAVEIPIVRQFLDSAPGAGLEVGNVLGHYGHTGHQVVDRWEQAEGVDNLDVFDITGRYGWVVAISTVEHVRWDEPDHDPCGAIAAVQHLLSLLECDGRMLVTVPMGHHPTLDDWLLRGDHGANASTLVRCHGGWVQTASPTWAPYGATTKWAESVWVGEW